MLVIRTGKPGHGKTLNTIKEVDAQAASTSRVVYFHNINGLQADKLQAQWYEFEDPTKWYDLPHNSIIVIDEAQGWFGNRDPRHKPEPHLTAFETMRHSGFEVHLITQDPRFLDTHARRLANVHIHYWRVMKSRQLLRFESEVVIDRVEVMSSFKDADKTRLRLDSKMFDKYTSSNAQHHFKFQPSKKLIWSIVVLLITAFLLYRVYSLYADRTSADGAEPPNGQAQPAVVSTAKNMLEVVKPQSFKDDQSSKPELDYFEQHTPRLRNVPSSAPIYDELTAPQTYPRLACMSSDAESFTARLNAWQVKDGVGCQCYTQQATRLDIEYDFCMSVVKHGYFDHARPDPVSYAMQQNPTLPPSSSVSSPTPAQAMPAARALY